MNKQYEKTDDKELISLIRGGDSDALDFLLNKYKDMVRKNAKDYFLLGGDRDDLIQEGMIGLYSAIHDFDETSGSPFAAFASLCVKRRIFKAIENANAYKNRPLNDFVSLSDKDDGEEENEYPKTDESNPENLILEREANEILAEKLKSVLSAFELKVLSLYLEKETYEEIAVKLNRTEKAVDNAIQRIRKKIRKII